MPYVVIRLISLSKKAGKTSLGMQLVSELLKRNVKVAVIKHCHREIDLADKDTYRYQNAGALEIIAIDDKRIVKIIPKTFSLTQLLQYIDPHIPLVIVEGFRRENVGIAIGIVNSKVELREIISKTSNLKCIVAPKNLCRDLNTFNIKCFDRNDVNSLVNFIISYAKETLLNLVPRLNCRMCGLESCNEFIDSVLKGSKLLINCPHLSKVRLRVNGKFIYINPFVRAIIQNVILGIVNTLKDIPREYKRIELELEID